MVGEYLFSKIAKKHINFTFGSEFPNYKDFLTNKTLLIAISQSGETADTLEAIEVAKEKGVKIASIVNVESSTMARISDIVIPIKAGTATDGTATYMLEISAGTISLKHGQ